MERDVVARRQNHFWHGYWDVFLTSCNENPNCRVMKACQYEREREYYPACSFNNNIGFLLSIETVIWLQIGISQCWGISTFFIGINHNCPWSDHVIFLPVAHMNSFIMSTIVSRKSIPFEWQIITRNNVHQYMNFLRRNDDKFIIYHRKCIVFDY